MANSYEEARRAFDGLIAPQAQLPTLEHDTLVASLSAFYTAGEVAVRAQTIGNVRFANEVTERYTGALAMNEQGLVQPPLSETEVKALQDKIETLSIFIEPNGETGRTQAKPTNPKKLSTRGKK